MRAVGVDGYSRGWVAVSLVDGRFERHVVAPSLASVLAALPDAAAYGVDIPIGVAREYPRAADVAARALLGRRASTVFLTPPKAVLGARSFAEATERMRELTGGLSRQAFALAAKILEVEPHALADERVIEVHPELSFYALAGTPLAASKHTWTGFNRRRALLEHVGIVLPEELPGAPLVDVLDAAAAGWTAARYARREAVPVPEAVAGRIGAIWR